MVDQAELTHHGRIEISRVKCPQIHFQEIIVGYDNLAPGSGLRYGIESIYTQLINQSAWRN